MPEINIEEKIQEALKRKSFKDNKLEYLGLGLIYCLMLFVTFVVSYFLPFLAIFIFIFVDIPLIMGFKHFIWFGPASGETLIEGFRVSMVCGYLNFVSYIKIFITTNLKAFLFSIIIFFVSNAIGGAILERTLGNEINSIFETLANGASYQDVIEAFLNNEAIMRGLAICSSISFAIAIISFYILKLRRALLPYISFLRLTSLEGKSMDGVLAHTKKIMNTKKWNYYLKSTAYHLLYIIPILSTTGIYFLMTNNPVYSMKTIELISSLVFFVTMFPAVLFIELNYRNFCIEINQEYIKEHKKMLNDAINDLDKNNKK